MATNSITEVCFQCFFFLCNAVFDCKRFGEMLKGEYLLPEEYFQVFERVEKFHFRFF